MHSVRSALLAVFFVSACSTLGRFPGSGVECVEREGDCFDVSIADEPAVPLVAFGFAWSSSSRRVHGLTRGRCGNDPGLAVREVHERRGRPRGRRRLLERFYDGWLDAAARDPYDRQSSRR